MATLKYKVVEEMHIRSFAPRLMGINGSENIIGVLQPGFVIDVVDDRFPGDTYRESNVWLKDANGFYYWKGATVRVGEETTVPRTEAVIPAWMEELLIPQIWKHSKGKGVGVAVIDTGINTENPELKYVSGYSLTGDSTNIKDTKGHGTHCAGLIGARNQNGPIIGVAPECDLYICKISDAVSLDSDEKNRYAEAIRWCAQQEGISIISISWSDVLLNPAIVNDLQNAVDMAVSNNKVVVCANGNSSYSGDKSLFYPAASKGTIGVGVIPAMGKPNPYFNGHLDVCTHGRDIISYTYQASNTLIDSGSSQATAIVSGILALAIALRKPDNIPSFAEDLLKRSSKEITFDNVKVNRAQLRFVREKK